MKTNPVLATALLVIFSISLSLPALKAEGNEPKYKTTGKQVKLFNGKNLDNWIFKLKDKNVDPGNVFKVSDGIIHISGNPFGYMRTRESYSDYKLHVEWRWPSEATNSGVFIHGQEPDSIWLKCVECQLKAGSAGDFICMNGSDMKERIDKKNVVVKKLSDSSEKPAGEWNIMEVICNENNITVYVNGTLQNKGTGLNLSAGSVCLQSEGRDVEFRNVFLKKLKK
jgi:hypothetical protein